MPLPPQERRDTDFLDRALALADVIVWRLDLLQQRLHYNAVGFRALGLAPTTAGISLQELRALTHPDDAPLLEQANRQALMGPEGVDQLARYRFADGSWRHQLTRRVAVRDADGVAVCLSGIAIDVTELQLEREQVQRLHEHTALAAQVLGAGFWSHQPDRQGHYVLQGDEQMLRIYGCQRGESPPDVGQWLHRFVHPEDRKWVGQRMRLADLRMEPLVDICYRIIDTGGRERRLHSWSHRMLLDGRLAVFGTEMDVTDSQQLQRERQRERQREKFAIEAAAVGIWERDLQGHVLYWNETMYRQRGCTSADPRHPDRIMVDTTHPEDRAVLVGAWGQHIASGEPYREELRLRLLDGSERWILAHGRPLRDDSGSVVRVYGINLDITAQKTAALLQQEKMRAEQASRDKSSFMARMSHELRTPMNAVLGFSQLMRDDPAQPMSRQQLQRLGLIEQAGRQLLTLIDNLLEIAQRADDAPAPGAMANEAQAATAPRQQPLAAAAPQATTTPTATTTATPAAAPTAAETAATAGPGLHVLCVEDNLVNLILVREVLAMRPQVRLRCAEDGHSGIAAALQEAPDVLLLDLQLPDISGHEVFRQLHLLQPLSACRFIALSADAMPESVEAALAAGFDDYWTKPIQFDRFLARIDELTAQRAGSGWSR